MFKFLPQLCGSMFAGLERTRMRASEREPNEFIHGDDKILSVETSLMTAIALGKWHHLPETLRCATELHRHFKKDEFNTLRFKDLEVGIEHLVSLLRSELDKHLFFQIPKDVLSYYDDPKPEEPTSFGKQVDDAFPSIRNDVVNAGKALACGLNNAAVYHLVCVAEIGLRALAWDRRVTVRHNKKIVPLEFAQWGELINKIEPEVAAIKNWRSKSLGAEALQFYNRALVEIRSFNSGWRTHVMHARGHTYQTNEATALFEHVKRFMQTLSEKISETQRTPKIWKKDP